MSSEHLDLKGLSCPIPVLRANKAMKTLVPGDQLVLEVTDPAAPGDFETYCGTTGHTLIACDEADGVFTITLQRRE